MDPSDDEDAPVLSQAIVNLDNVVRHPVRRRAG